MRKPLLTAFAGLVVAGGLAWAASSTSFINDPEVFDQGGGVIASTSYDLHGSIGGVAMSADFGGGNQSGTGSSSSFITVIGFPESANTGGGGGGASPVIVQAGNSNPGASNELASTTATIAMQQFVVTAGSAGNIFINSITITATGTGDDLNDVSAVDVWTDANGNGAVDGGETVAASQQTFSADNGTAVFTPGTPIQINAGNSRTFLVTYTYAGTASATDTFAAGIGVGGLNVVNALSQSLTPSGLPVSGGTKTMVAIGTPGTLTMSVGPANPGGTSLTLPTDGSPATATPWLQFQLAASSVEAVIVNTLRLTATGTLHDTAHISNVTLYRDSGVTPGAVDASDVALAAGGYSGDNGSITFTGLTETVTAGNRQVYLISYDVAATATPGGTAAATIVANTDITTTGGSSFGAVPVNGAPVGSLRFIATTPPTTTVVIGATTVTPGSSGGGCSASAPGTPLPAGNPIGVSLPWLLGALTLLLLRRRDA